MNDQEYIRTHQPDEIIEYECNYGPIPCRAVCMQHDVKTDSRRVNRKEPERLKQGSRY